MFLSDQYPLIIIEICSKGNEVDRCRMLLQGGLLVRAMNSFKPTGSLSFVAMAIYISNDFVANRYLIYQPDRTTDIEVRSTDSSIPDHCSSFFL